MLKVLVFDWDGTIANSVGKIGECKIFLAEKYGYPPPCEEVVRKVLGKKFEEALAICFPSASSYMLSQIGKEFHELMKEELYQAALFPGVIEVLSQLKEKGFKLAIATSKNPGEMKKALADHFLEETFDMVCCGEQFESKPSPKMLEYIMESWAVRPEECLMIGDTIFDIEFSQNANIPVIAVTFGAHSHDKLQSYSPLALVDNWLQLQNYILTYAEGLCSQNQQASSLS